MYWLVFVHVYTHVHVNMADAYIISSSRRIDLLATKAILLLPMHVGFLKIFSIILGFSDVISLERVRTEINCFLNLIFPSSIRWRSDRFSVAECFSVSFC